MICCIRIQKNVIRIIDDSRYKAHWHNDIKAQRQEKIKSLRLKSILTLTSTSNLILVPFEYLQSDREKQYSDRQQDEDWQCYVMITSPLIEDTSDAVGKHG